MTTESPTIDPWPELVTTALLGTDRRPLPGGAARIEAALRSLRGGGLLSGGRGRPTLDIGAAARLVERCGELLLSEQLELIELNPVIVSETGAVAVDASVRRGRSPTPRL